MAGSLNNLKILQLENVNKEYKQSEEFLKILTNSSLSVFQNETVACVGTSGCGKTTLLQLCGLLDTPTSGNLFIQGINVSHLTDKEKTNIRKNQIGFIFQFHHLLPEFSVLENIMLPFLVVNGDKKQAKERAKKILSELKIENKMYFRPNQLSGGEKQRVAIGRAIINNPPLLLADEPTGNLDPDNAEIVFSLLLNIVKQYNSSLLMVTHDINLAKRLNRTITIQNGKIINL